MILHSVMRIYIGIFHVKKAGENNFSGLKKVIGCILRSAEIRPWHLFQPVGSATLHGKV
jgi:hypothetical protein